MENLFKRPTKNLPSRECKITSICAPQAPSLLISSGHSPRLGGAQFSFGGARPRYGHRGAGSVIFVLFIGSGSNLQHINFLQPILNRQKEFVYSLKILY